MAAAGAGAEYLGWVVLSGATALVAIVRVLRRPPESWKHRNWSKLGWITATLYLAPSVGGYPVPLGAVVAIWLTLRPVGPAVGRVADPSASDWPLPWGGR